ncbi:MAG: hypothetical protein EB100_07930 [Crocinitomicaceae bacterium]|jgi:hypothetical protein|nr:hypothetical protein [Crocinitomicaceae bacterium]
MKVQITDTFIDSLKRMNRHQTWWYKTYSTIRYDIPLFVKNVWRFRRELWNHQWWDYRYNLEMMYRSLSITYKGISERGIEADYSREPKVKAMKRALELLKHKLDDDYVERAQTELGPLSEWDWDFDENGFMIDKDTPGQKEHNRLVFKKAKELEDQEWKELWDIFKGSRYSKKYGPKYDGSDMRSWWD